MHRPKDVTQRLDISSTTLRRWATVFSAYLSPMAGSSIAETGGAAQRRFTDQDVALLAAIQRELAAGRRVEEVALRLERGEIAPDVVALDDDAMAAVEPPTSGSDALVSPMGGSTPVELQRALVAFLQSAPQMTRAITHLQETADALRETTATQRATLEAQTALLRDLQAERAMIDELRAEREALATERDRLADELAASRDSPLVPIPHHGVPQAPVKGWQWLKRLFTGQS